MRPTVVELEAQLKDVTDQKTRIDLLYKLSRHIGLVDLDRSRLLAEQAYESASSGEFEREPYLLGQAAGLCMLAYCDNTIGKFDAALAQSFRTLEILESLPNDRPEINSVKVDALGNISWAFRSFGDYGVATEYAMQALKIVQNMEDRLLA
jgi:hypothetical protein